MSIEIKHPGLFHKETGTPAGQKIPEAKIRQKLHSPDAKVRERAQFAENAKHWSHGNGGHKTSSFQSHGAKPA
jgi:oligoendopeptidase F